MKKVQRVEFIFEVVRTVLGVLIALAITVAIIALAAPKSEGGVSGAIYNFAIGPFTSRRRFGQLLVKYIPYLLSGCGMCFMYACGRFSLVAEGTINFAPILACLLMFGTNIMTNLPLLVNLLIMLIICITGGVICGLVPAIGREELGASEMVTSIIMNYMLLYLSQFILKGTVADRSQAYLASPIYPDNMHLTRIWTDSNFNTGIFVALVGVVIACLLFYRTRIGCKIKLVGSNLSFAEYSGINTKAAMYAGQIICGVFAGAAAFVDAFGLYTHYWYQILTNIGFDGLLVAVLARKQPIFVPLTAFILAYIRTASVVLNANSNIPIELCTMMQAVLVLFVAAEGFLQKPKQRIIFKMSREAAAEATKEA